MITVELTNEEMKKICIALHNKVDSLLEKHDETGEEKYLKRACKIDAIWDKMWSYRIKDELIQRLEE